MALHHFPQIVSDSVLFYFDSRRTANYVGSTVTSAIGTKQLSATNVTRSGTSTLFNNITDFWAASYITDSSHDSSFINRANITASVTFKQTGVLDSGAPWYWRQTPFSFGQDGTKGEWAFEIFNNSNLVIRYNFDSSNTYGNELLLTSSSLLNKWTNVAFVNDGSKIKGYLNGVKVAEVSVANMTVTSNNTARLTVGASSSGTPIYGFIGNIDSAIFYSRALSDDEILRNAKSFLARCL